MVSEHTTDKNVVEWLDLKKYICGIEAASGLFSKEYWLGLYFIFQQASTSNIL